jgi:hypothetical protein
MRDERPVGQHTRLDPDVKCRIDRRASNTTEALETLLFHCTTLIPTQQVGALNSNTSTAPWTSPSAVWHRPTSERRRSFHGALIDGQAKFASIIPRSIHDHNSPRLFRLGRRQSFFIQVLLSNHHDPFSLSSPCYHLLLREYPTTRSAAAFQSPYSQLCLRAISVA